MPAKEETSCGLGTMLNKLDITCKLVMQYVSKKSVSTEVSLGRKIMEYILRNRITKICRALVGLP